MNFENIKLEQSGELAYLVLNRPDKFNALSRRTIREMIAALESLCVSEETRVVIIRAEGKHFCSGHDLSEMSGRETADYRDIFVTCNRMMNLIGQVPQPVIAQVHGIATAAGCQLVAACDLAVAEEGSSFGTPGVRVGLFCATPMVPLVRAIGRKRAMEMLLTGRSVPAAEAASWGLINKMVPKDRLADETADLARSIAQFSAMAIGIGKQAFYAQVDMTTPQAYDLAQNVMTTNLTTQDAQAGIKAFLEKRKPVWQGR